MTLSLSKKKRTDVSPQRELSVIDDRLDGLEDTIRGQAATVARLSGGMARCEDALTRQAEVLQALIAEPKRLADIVEAQRAGFVNDIKRLGERLGAAENRVSALGQPKASAEAGDTSG